MPQPPPFRVITYIDGFNLYYGMRAAGYRRYYWLDLVALSRNLTKPNQTLVATKYFTARIAGPRPADSTRKKAALEEKRKRQTRYLDALQTLPNFLLYEGHYLPKDRRCRQCDARWTDHEEKMTDVNIATQLLLDGFHDAFDTAIIISGDSDLTPPTLALREHFPEKHIIVAFPPKRHSVQLKRAAHTSFTLGRATIKRSLLPEQVVQPNGHVLKQPDRWR